MRIGVSLTRAGAAAVALCRDGEIRTSEVDNRRRPLVDLVAELLRDLLGASSRDRDQTTSVTFDVSQELALEAGTRFTVLRIAPRPPVDGGEVMSHKTGVGFDLEVLHAAGGHTILGDELVSLDTAGIVRAARSTRPGGRFVVSGVGSLVSPAHELRAGQLLLEHADPETVEYGHRFHSGAIAVRERTALVNSSHLTIGASLGTSLALAVGTVLPQARLYVTTNDGGSTPIARLSVSPVHSLYAGRPTELIAAARLCGVEEGRYVVAGRDHAFYGEVSAGVPAVVPSHHAPAGLRVATQSANLRPVADSSLGGHQEPPLVVTHGEDPVPVVDLPEHLHSLYDLRALGAACAPLSDWANRVVNVSNASEMGQALRTAEARVAARLVAFGALPSQIRILESRVMATAYQHPRVVSVRVRGVAGLGPETLLVGAPR